MMETVAFVQARMSSTRYPGKVLIELAGMPLILFMIQRVQKARLVDEVVLVTSTTPEDDALAVCAKNAGVSLFRGPLDDVLGRFALAAQIYPAKNYVRLTGDCPLSDPTLIDAVVSAHIQSGCDYTCNTNPPTYPDGLDVEVFTSVALSNAVKSASSPSEREHVTAWMYNPKNGLCCKNFESLFNASHLRLTVDYPDDAVAVQKVIAALKSPLDADYLDILRAISDNSSIPLINQHVRNETFLN
jgi:spore coat polysaccharide biosynthesis protein SpsF